MLNKTLYLDWLGSFCEEKCTEPYEIIDGFICKEWLHKYFDNIPTKENDEIVLKIYEKPSIDRLEIFIKSINLEHMWMAITIDDEYSDIGCYLGLSAFLTQNKLIGKTFYLGVKI